MATKSTDAFEIEKVIAVTLDRPTGDVIAILHGGEDRVSYMHLSAIAALQLRDRLTELLTGRKLDAEE